MPPPSAVVSLGLATLPSSIFLSSTVTVVLLTVVVVPLTVRFPPIVASPIVVSPLTAENETVPLKVLLPVIV